MHIFMCMVSLAAQSRPMLINAYFVSVGEEEIEIIFC